MTTLQQQNYTSETVKEVAEIQKHNLNGETAIINGGYPIYNECDHTTLDMSHLKNGTEKYMHTLSIKLDDDTYFTINVMKLMGDETNIDTKFHGKGVSSLINFKDGKSQPIANTGTVALIHNK